MTGKRDKVDLRLKELEKERKMLEKEIRNLSRRVESMPEGMLDKLENEQRDIKAEQRSLEDNLGAYRLLRDMNGNQTSGKQDTERLNHYLSTGSFGKKRLRRSERRVLRNKAIFMIVLVVVMSVIIIRLSI